MPISGSRGASLTPEPQEFEITLILAIPDNDEHGVTVEVVVPNGLTGQVSVTALFSHEDLSQVKVGLLSPTGGSWELLAAGVVSGDTCFEETFLLDPQPVGELTEAGNSYSPILRGKTGLVEQFKMSIDQ